MSVGLATILPAMAGFSLGAYVCFYAVAKAKVRAFE